MQFLRRYSRVVIGVGVVLMITAGTAAATSLTSSAPAKKSNPVAGVVAFAKVDQTGTLLAGRGVTSVTKTAPGDYLVGINHNIESCANVAGDREVVGNEFTGLVETYTTDSSTVRVVTASRDGTHADGNGFNLIVSCEWNER